MRDRSDEILKGVGVITGAGSGLGRALSIALSKKGMKVAGLGRRPEALDEVASQISEDHFLGIATDVSQPDQVQAAFEKITSKWGPVTLLINNAAVYPRVDFLDETPESFMQTMAINLGGTVNCCHHALKDMVAQGYGRIVNVVTFADLAPIALSSAYSVSKGSQKNFTKALCADLCDRFPDIVINDWVPGALQTPMGLPDGIPPETAAQWGANLALMHERDLSGTIFSQDKEHLPLLSKKQKLINLLRGHTPKVRHLGSSH